jgi:hypothetical protein
MAQTFKEKEAVVRSLLPSMSKTMGEELHGSIDTLATSAANSRLTGEYAALGPKAVARADLNMRIARNVSDLRLEGSTPVRERFTGMLTALR